MAIDTSKLLDNQAHVAMNLHRNFLIKYHRAVKTYSSEDWFEAALAAKQWEFYLRTKLSLWQQIKYAIRLLELNKTEEECLK